MAEGLPEHEITRRKIIRVRGAMAWGYLEMHRIMDSAGLFLTDVEVDCFDVASHIFLTSLQKLCTCDGKWIWRIRPKHHHLEHIVLDLKYVSKLNPKKISCLLEEDFMGKIKKLGAPCRGLTPISMCGRVLDRYILKMKLRWHRRAVATA